MWHYYVSTDESFYTNPNGLVTYRIHKEGHLYILSEFRNNIYGIEEVNVGYYLDRDFAEVL